MRMGRMIHKSYRSELRGREGGPGRESCGQPLVAGMGEGGAGGRGGVGVAAAVVGMRVVLGVGVVRSRSWSASG